MNNSNTKVYWTPSEIVQIVNYYITRYGNAKPSIDLFNSAVAGALPADRRGTPFISIFYNKRGNLQVALMLIHEKQGHPERNNRFEGEFGERSKLVYEQARSLLFNHPDKPPLSSTITPAPLEMNDPDLILLKLGETSLSGDQVKFLLSHQNVSIPDMLQEIERRRTEKVFEEVKLLRNEVQILKDNIQALKEHPPVVTQEVAPAPPEPEKPKLRKIVLITNVSSQIASYEDKLDKLDVDVLSRNDTPIHMINPKSEAIIVLAKFTNHSNRHNAKKVSSQYGIPFFEIHGTGQLRMLLQSMNEDEFWQQ